MKKLLIASLMAFSATALTPMALADITEAEAVALYENLVGSEATAEEIILALVDAGMSLEDATAFAISQSNKVGFAAALAHVGVCLAADEWIAQDVADAAIEGASAQAKNAVEARAVESVKNYGKGGCHGVVDTKKGSTPPFGKPPKSGGGVSTDQ